MGGQERRPDPEQQAPDGTDPPDPPATLPVVPRDVYEVKEEVARGGLGRVIKAWDRRMGRVVAVKEILGSDEDSERRFVREALVTGRLEHPGIVPVHEAGRWPTGEPFYAMKLVSGCSLLELIRRARTLRDRLALLPHVLAVAEAIAYAHSRGVIHRDIKPANVIVGQFGETVVIDWGLAKAIGDDPDGGTTAVGAHGTLVGDVVGTPAYMAPEQARGADVDARADVYTLGGLLYHLLTGSAPFRLEDDDRPIAAQMTALLVEVAERRVVPLEQREPEAPHELAAIARKAMAFEPAERYPSARELADDLRAFLTGQLVSAHAYTTLTLLRRWVRRHRAVVLLSAAFLIFAIAAGAVAVARILREHGEAQAQRREADRRRGEAEARRNQLVLLQAHAEIGVDPTAALAWLKQYPLDGDDWDDVQAIAAEAESAGIAAHVWRGREGALTAVAVSPDGQWVAAGGVDGKIRLSSMVGQDPVVLTASGPVGALRFHGRTLLAAEGKRLVAWDLADPLHPPTTGREVGAHDAVIVTLAVAPDGHSVGTVGLDAAFRRWPLGGGSAIAGWQDPALMSYGLAFLPDGTVVTRAREEELRLWSPAGVARTLANPEAFGPIAVSPDGKRIAVGGGTAVHLWTVDGTYRALAKQPDFVLDVTFSPDGKTLATGSSGGMVRLWDLASGAPSPLIGHRGPVNGVAYFADGAHLASAGDDGSVRVWSIGPRGPVRAERLFDQATQVSEPQFSPDGRRIVVGGKDGVHAWDGETLRPEPVLRTEHPITQLAHLADGRLVTVDEEREIAVWTGGAPRRLYRSEAAVRDIQTAGTRISLVDGHDAVVVLDVAASAPACRLAGHGMWTSALSPDGERVAYADGGEVRVANISDCSSRRLHERGTEVLTMAWSPDGRFVSAAVDKAVAVSPTDGGEVRWLMGHEQSVRAIRFLRDSRHLASASVDRTVRLWDITTGETTRVFDQHDAAIWSMALTADERTVVTVSLDHLLRVWGLEDGTLRVLRGHTDAIRGVAVSPDGKRVVTTSRDGTIRAWPLGPGGPPADPTLLRKWLADATSTAIDERNVPTSP